MGDVVEIFVVPHTSCLGHIMQTLCASVPCLYNWDNGTLLPHRAEVKHIKDCEMLRYNGNESHKYPRQKSIINLANFQPLCKLQLDIDAVKIVFCQNLLDTD